MIEAMASQPAVGGGTIEQRAGMEAMLGDCNYRKSPSRKRASAIWTPIVTMPNSANGRVCCICMAADT